MKSRRILEGFPIHLLLPPREPNSITLVFLDSSIGKLQINMVPDEGRNPIVILPPMTNRKPADALSIREQYRKSDLIVANMDAIPFPSDSVDEIIFCLRIGKSDELQRYTKILSKLLKKDGVICYVNCTCAESMSRSIDVPSSQYYVFSPDKRIYFVTGAKITSIRDWPFSSLTLGAINRLKVFLRLILNRIDRIASSQLIRIIIFSPDDHEAIITRWMCVTDDKTLRPSHTGLYVKTDWNAIIVGLKKLQLIVKFPLSAISIARIEDNAKAIDSLKVRLSPNLGSKIPEILRRGNIGGQSYFEESLLPGASASSLRFTRNWKRKTSESGVHYLSMLHQETAKRVKINNRIFDRLFPRKNIDDLIFFARQFDNSFDLSCCVDLLKMVIFDRQLPLVQSHGDYWPGNLLVNDKAELEAVLDWDASRPDSWPVIDLLHLLAYQNKHIAYWKFGPEVTNRIMPKNLKQWEHQLINQYFTDLNISPDLWVFFVAIYWLERSIQWVITDSSEEAGSELWTKRNIVNAAPIVTSRIKSEYFDRPAIRDT